MEEKNELTLDLQLMGEDGAESAEAGDNSRDAAGAETATQQAEATEPVDLEAEFDKLVKGEGKFREIYGKRVQKASLERNKGMKASVERLNAMQPALEIMAARYGMDPNDPALVQRIAGDESLLEEIALKNGNSTQTEVAMARARAAEQRANQMVQQMLAQQDMQRWQAQAEEIKQEFPEFDLNEELNNPEFGKLLKSGVDMQGAYMALHHRDIRQQIVRNTEKRVTDNVAAGKSRPRENGTGSQSGAAMVQDPSRMTSAEFNDYMKRIERGERISFSK